MVKFVLKLKGKHAPNPPERNQDQEGKFERNWFSFLKFSYLASSKPKAMKTKYIFIFLLSIALASCIRVKTGDGSHEIEKNGSEVTDNSVVEAFNQLDINGVFQVYLKQGEQESLVIETDKAVAKHIISKVSNNTFYLSMEDDCDLGDIDPIKIYMHVYDLKS